METERAGTEVHSVPKNVDIFIDDGKYMYIIIDSWVLANYNGIWMLMMKKKLFDFEEADKVANIKRNQIRKLT